MPAAGGTGPRTPERCRVQPGERGAHYLRAVRPAGRNGPEPWRHGRRSGHLDEGSTPVAFLQRGAGRRAAVRTDEAGVAGARPAQAVLTCFHRVLLLGFRGRYQDPVAPERDQLISTLNGLVAPFGVLPETAVLNVPLSPVSILCCIRRFSGW